MSARERVSTNCLLDIGLFAFGCSSGGLSKSPQGQPPQPIFIIVEVISVDARCPAFLLHSTATTNWMASLVDGHHWTIMQSEPEKKAIGRPFLVETLVIKFRWSSISSKALVRCFVSCNSTRQRTSSVVFLGVTPTCAQRSHEVT